MGSAYSKGYVKGLIKYLKENDLYKKVVISLMADFDPFQANKLTAEDNIDTQQFLHDGGIFGVADREQEGAEEYYENDEESSHRVMTFFNEINNLREGSYEWDSEKNEWKCISCDSYP